VRLPTAPPPVEDVAPSDVDSDRDEERAGARREEADPSRAAPADPLGA
jgi:hypothetical protein